MLWLFAKAINERTVGAGVGGGANPGIVIVGSVIVGIVMS
jgi:hypothetical protein